MEIVQFNMLRAVTPCSLQSWKQLINVSDDSAIICRIKMEAVVSPETSDILYQPTLRHSPEDSNR